MSNYAAVLVSAPEVPPKSSDRRKAGKIKDIDALVRYIKALPRPVTPRLEGRVRRMDGRP